MTEEERDLLLHLTHLVRLTIPGTLDIISELVEHINDDELSARVLVKVQAMHVQHDLMTGKMA